MNDYTANALSVFAGFVLSSAAVVVAWRRGSLGWSQYEQFRTVLAAFSVAAVFAIQIMGDNFGSIAGEKIGDARWTASRILVSFAMGLLLSPVILAIDAVKPPGSNDRNLRAAATVIFYAVIGAVLALLLAVLLNPAFEYNLPDLLSKLIQRA